MNKNVINNRTYRRFIVKGNAKKEQAAFALMERKGLSREDLILLLETYELNEQNWGLKPQRLKIGQTMYTKGVKHGQCKRSCWIP